MPKASVDEKAFKLNTRFPPFGKESGHKLLQLGNTIFFIDIVQMRTFVLLAH